MHLVDVPRLAGSVPQEVVPTSGSGLLSQFLSLWVLEMAWNTVCDNVPSAGRPPALAFDPLCRATPAMVDDPALCKPTLFSDRAWYRRAVWRPAGSKALRCKAVQSRCARSH